MELFQEILDEIVGSAKGNMRDKIKQMIDQRNLIKTLNNMEGELDTYLKDNYGNETYYESLYKYIHSGKVYQDTYSDEKTSIFYYTLICAFLNSDDKYLGENNFCELHWEKIKENYTSIKLDQNSIKKCFLHYYNTFKDKFGFPSETDRPSVNAIKETVIENNNNLIKKLTDESSSIKATFNEGIEKILKQGNTEEKNTPEKEEKICDNNYEYQERFKDTLFLETDINDGKKASLDDIHIEPHIEFAFTNLKEWVEARDSRILLLYGKAGIGKTSFTTWLSLNNDFNRECHILELRKFISELDSDNSWEAIKKCFNCTSNDEYQNKVLILDGLDEVCVLKSDFDGHDFINNLRNSLRFDFGRGIRIIVTARMGYFNSFDRDNYIEVATIFWKEDSVEKWCEAYSKIHTNRSEWCEAFKKAYADLGANDKRKDVFCTPIILYICCVSQIDISKHDSVASIYDEAFNVIGKRRYNELPQISKNEFKVSRQFTKELAFQMFLNDMLEDIISGDFVRIAKEKVVNWAQSNLSYHVNEPEFEKLFAINHFAYGKNNAIEFAHKTIGEYFTAVKLYEDYFEQIDGTPENIWQNIFNAFRYKAIPEDIMQYLVDITLSKQDDSWKDELFKAYYIGIEKQLLFACDDFKLEYSPSHTAIIKQIQITFRNLTWLLTGLEFDNSQFDNTIHNSQILTSFFCGDININGWKNLENISAERADLECANLSLTNLKGCNFKNATLDSARLISSNLINSNLINANLNEASLIETRLTGARLTGARLTGARLTRSNLIEADLSEADLSGANLIEADLSEANLSGADLSRADLTNARLKMACLRGTRFIRTHLYSADFQRAMLQRADLRRADLQSTNFKFAILLQANLQNANLQKACLQKASLVEASLQSTNFKFANLAGANLQSTNSKYAKFFGADLTETIFYGAQLEGADLTNTNLEKAHLEGAYLRGAHLEKTDLTMTFLDGAHFKEAHLEGARLTKEDYNEAKRQGAYLDSEPPEDT